MLRLVAIAALLVGCGDRPDSTPPALLLGADAYAHVELWPRLRIGARTYMRSTYDRNGGNSDASNFLREDDPDHSVTLDVAGQGVLAFVRTNHWHGSPWHYIADGDELIVSEDATAMFEPAELFPAPLAVTWPTTQGADLSWVPIPFTQSFTLAYGRTYYGTGYYIYTLVAPGARTLTPIAPWNRAAPSPAIAALLSAAGSDLAPPGDAHAGQLALAAGEAADLVTLSGPAAIRAITLSTTDASALGRARLQITWDDLPQPSVDAPVALLFGAGSLDNPENKEFLVRGLPAVIRFEQGTVVLALYFPMPFARAAHVRLVADDAIANLDWTLRTAPHPDPPRWSGYFHATYVDHGSLATRGHDLVLLDTRSVEGGGDVCGHFVGTSFIFSDRAVLSTLEGDPRFFFDDSNTPQAQGTGTEEWGGGGDYWQGGKTSTLPLAGHPVVGSGYRFLLADAMPFGKNARIQLEHGADDLSTEHYQTVTYWYARPSACLRLTDTLHVGDPDDEAAHEYASPTASEPTALTSRYETFDGDPSTDTGRNMTGTSEFRLTIDPDNLGVMLRRKLDYAYADQRADVFVDDKPAGTWYLAGSSTWESSFPADELGPVMPMLHTGDRRWREDEFLLPPALTVHRSSVRIRVVFVPGAHPILPGLPPPPNAWSEFGYQVYSYVRPE